MTRGGGAARVAAVVVVVALLVGAACTRSGDEAREEVESQGTPSGSVSSDELDAALDAGTFGTLAEVCGPAPDGQVNQATGSLGVTADSITVGTFSDPNNFARPGLNQELFDAGKVFVAWCNELGGINGRRIALNEHDAALTKYRAQVVEACKTDFFLVGGGAVMDNTGQEERLSCMLPTVDAFTASPDGGASDLRVWTGSSGSVMGPGLGRYLMEEYPGSSERVGFFTGNLDVLKDISEGLRSTAEHYDWTIVYDDQYNAIGESTWQPYAQKIKDSGVRGLLYLGEPQNLGLLVQALAQINYPLDWIISTPNAYDTTLVDTAGAALATVPVYTELSSVPFEEAEGSPAMASYLRLFERYLPDGKVRTMLGVTSFSKWLQFATAAKACGAELTRRCVWDELTAMPLWDGGGMYPIVPPQDGQPVGCFVPMKATPEGFEAIVWERNHTVFNCDAANMGGLVEELSERAEGDDPPGVRLADVGKTMDDLR